MPDQVRHDGFGTFYEIVKLNVRTFKILKYYFLYICTFVAVHGFKGSEVQGYVLVPGLHFGGVFM